MLNKEYMYQLIIQTGLNVPRDLTIKLDLYARLLVEWNEKMNLTAITEPDEIALKHFMDSLLPLSHCEIPDGAALIDVGTGAGFPGVVMKLCRPDLRLTLLDSLGKRMKFLEALCEALEIEADCIHARAEEGARRPELRERFDVATARAVAALPALCEYCLPYVRKGGVFLALKGRAANQEAEDARTAIARLGGSLEKLEAYTLPPNLPDGEQRAAVLVRKISHTATQYPRNQAQMTKKPL